MTSRVSFYIPQYPLLRTAQSAGLFKRIYLNLHGKRTVNARLFRTQISASQVFIHKAE